MSPTFSAGIAATDDLIVLTVAKPGAKDKGILVGLDMKGNELYNHKLDGLVTHSVEFMKIQRTVRAARLLVCPEGIRPEDRRAEVEGRSLTIARGGVDEPSTPRVAVEACAARYESRLSSGAMRIGILSMNPQLYSTKRLVEAVEKRGHEAVVVEFLRCYMEITAHRPQVLYQGEVLEEVDAIIPRIGVSNTFYGTAVVRQFEMMGVYSVNESQAISRSRDKLRSLQLLARAGVGLPVTGFAHSTKDTDGLLKLVGGAPVVLKMLEGTQGLGVILADTKNAAKAVIEAFRNIEANILVQEFIKEAGGADLRCFVVGKRVVASMMRQGPEGEFRSNLHRGGTAKKIKLTPEERMTAVRAAKTMGLRVAGVDLLRSNHGPVVMEVNSSPGLEGIEKSTKVDVADKIVELIEKEKELGRGTKDGIGV